MLLYSLAQQLVNIIKSFFQCLQDSSISVLNYFYLLQPKSEDEEGWKKFCLGERVYSEIDAQSDNENLGIDYIKVSIGLLSNFQLLFSRITARNNPTVYYHFLLNRK